MSILKNVLSFWKWKRKYKYGMNLFRMVSLTIDIQTFCPYMTFVRLKVSYFLLLFLLLENKRKKKNRISKKKRENFAFTRCKVLNSCVIKLDLV